MNSSNSFAVFPLVLRQPSAPDWGEQSIFMSSSVAALCEACQSWPAKWVSSSRDGRRKQIQPHMHGILASPDKVNTESAVDLMFNAARIVPLVTQTNWSEYLAVFEIVTRQLVLALRDQATVRRWLEYHPGGLNMVGDQLVLLWSVVQNAETLVGPEDAALVRAVAAAVVGNMLEATCCWQPPEQVRQWWTQLEATLPPPGAAFTILTAVVSDSVRAARQLSTRSFFSFKADHVALQAHNTVCLRETVRLVGKVFLHPSSVGVPVTHRARCASLVAGCIWMPHYKNREFALVTDCLLTLEQSLSSSDLARDTSGEYGAALQSVFERACAASEHSNWCIPEKERLKARQSSQEVVDVFPWWDASAVARLVVLVFRWAAARGLVEGTATAPRRLLRRRLTLTFASIPFLRQKCAVAEALVELARSDDTALCAAISDDVEDGELPLSAGVCTALLQLPFQPSEAPAHVVLVTGICALLERIVDLCTKRLGHDSFSAPTQFVAALERALNPYHLGVVDNLRGADDAFAPPTVVWLWKCQALRVVCRFACGISDAKEHPEKSFVELHDDIVEVGAAKRLVRDTPHPPQLFDEIISDLQQRVALFATAVWRCLSNGGCGAAPDGFLLRLNELISLSTE